MEETDFNLIKGYEYGSPTLFVGSLSPECTPESIELYFSKFGGKVKSKLIMDCQTMRSKQCALLFCPDLSTAQRILDHKSHTIQNRTLRLSWADEQKKGTKTVETMSVGFVGNIGDEQTEHHIINYFKKFGEVIQVKFFKNKSTPTNTKNAFIKFSNEDGLNRMLAKSHCHKLAGRSLKCAPFKPNAKAYQLGGGSSEGYTQINQEIEIDRSQTKADRSGLVNTSQSNKDEFLRQPIREISHNTNSRIDFVKSEQHGKIWCGDEKQKQNLNYNCLHVFEYEEDELFRIFSPVLHEKSGKPTKYSTGICSDKSENQSTESASRGSSDLYC